MSFTELGNWEGCFVEKKKSRAFTGLIIKVEIHDMDEQLREKFMLEKT